jgi:hypothetical protein
MPIQPIDSCSTLRLRFGLFLCLLLLLLLLLIMLLTSDRQLPCALYSMLYSRASAWI